MSVSVSVGVGVGGGGIRVEIFFREAVQTENGQDRISRVLMARAHGEIKKNPVQVMANLEGGCPRGSRLGVLCRPPSGWQPDLNGVGAGYLFLVDNRAQASTRSIKLGHGYLGVSRGAHHWRARDHVV